MPVSTHDFFYFLVPLCLKKQMLKLTDIKVKKKNYNIDLKSGKLPDLSRLEFRKKSDLRVGRKRSKQNGPKERRTKFNRCRRPSEWLTAPNSGT
jgi:hypothetical protein